MTDAMTDDEFDMLEYVYVGHCNGFAGMFTGRLFVKRVAEYLAARGLLARIELQPADDDGHIQWTRTKRHGYALTPAGKTALEHARAVRATSTARADRLSAALDRLAARIEMGELLLATDPAAFLEAVTAKLDELTEAHRGVAVPATPLEIWGVTRPEAGTGDEHEADTGA